MAAKLSGTSGKKYEISQNAEINVTPFVDVMLVLLIIFMVAAPLATQSLKLDIPPAVPPPPSKEQPPKPLLVQIDKEGGLVVGVIDGAPTKVASLPVLTATIKSYFNTNNYPIKDRKIFIKADPDVHYGDFMGVMNELEGNGLDKVGLVTEDIT